jgi:hypothetical protein
MTKESSERAFASTKKDTAKRTGALTGYELMVSRNASKSLTNTDNRVTSFCVINQLQELLEATCIIMIAYCQEAIVGGRE